MVWKGLTYSTDVQFLGDGLSQSRQSLDRGVAGVELVCWPRPLLQEARQRQKRTNHSAELEGVASFLRTGQP